MIGSRSAVTAALAVALIGCGSPQDDGVAGAGPNANAGSSFTGGMANLGGTGAGFGAGTGVIAGTGAIAGTGGGVSGMGGVTSGAGGATSGTGGVTSGTGGATSGTGGTAGPPLGAPGHYVSPDGDDANPGTEEEPFQTITKARDVVRTVKDAMTEDLHVYLRGGRYDIRSIITFGPEDSGTNGHTIHYQAYPGETPVLNGATQVTGWTAHDANIQKASLNRTTKLRNLYVNDVRAVMANKTITAKGGYGTYSVTAGQASWAWVSGSKSDGVAYAAADLPAIASNKDDLEIVNWTTWNENIVCVRDVITTPQNDRVLLLQQPYGAIAQLPGWDANFKPTGMHMIFNAIEFLDEPGEFYFDKTTQTLYYYPRPGEDMATADVEVPVMEALLDIAGSSTSERAENLSFEGLTFANTGYALLDIDGSCGKASVQAATVFIAYGDGNQHNSQYEIMDTLPSMIHVSNADSIHFVGNAVKHSGNEGISMINDVVNSSIVGNSIRDIAGSGITIGHPQHVYVGDGGTHARFSPDVEGICTDDTISNNLIYGASLVNGFGGHAGLTAFFVDGLSITHNEIHGTSYNGISLGWGWRNFLDSVTCRDNLIEANRFLDTLSRLHDSGAVYTIGQMPDTGIHKNYVKGIPPATSGPTYGLHNDEGSAYITENDNVLDIDPGVTYTINAEDFGAKHDLTILRTYATVNKMGIDPPNSTIDPPIVVADAVWPLAQYETCVSSGIEDAYRNVFPAGLISPANHVFPASAAVDVGTASLMIRSAGDASYAVWFAPSGTTQFTEGANMTKAAGDATSIAVPTAAGTYKLSVVDSQGTTLDESTALLRVE